MTDKKLRINHTTPKDKSILNYLNHFKYDLDSESQKKNSLENQSKFNLINYYYNQTSESNYEQDLVINYDCFVVRLALCLIDYIYKNNFKLSEKNNLSNHFYKTCMENLYGSTLRKEINDDELLIIYVKQTVRLFWSANILSNEKGTAKIRDNNTNENYLYLKLFQTFWNIIKWEEIFPSNVNAARELHFSKTIFIDLIKKNNGIIKVNSIINEYFELTDFGNKNNLLLISFIDFYFLTWLKHFGIIKYINKKNTSPVSFKITESGIRFLSLIR